MSKKTSSTYKRVLVTGSAGFIGSHMVDYLSTHGQNVWGVDDLSGGFLRNVSDKKRFTKLDLRSRQKTAAYINQLKPDLIFHLAADATEGRSQFTPFSALDRNLTAYYNLLIPAIKNGLKKMLLVSSMSVYGKQKPPFTENDLPQPEDIYGISKAAMEESTKVLSNVYGFQYTIIRPHNVYGPRQNLSDPYRNVIGIFINRLLGGKNFYIYGDGEQKRAFSYIDDIVPATIEAAFQEKAHGHIFNLGFDHPVTLKQLGEVVLNTFFQSKKIAPEFLPIFLAPRPQEVKEAFCQHTKAKHLLNFQAKTTLETGVAKTLEWAKTMGPQKFVYLADLDLKHSSLPETWKSKLI